MAHARESQHPGNLADFGNSSRKRKLSEAASTSTPKQLTLNFASGRVPQKQLDSLIVNFVVDSLQPFSVVEAPSFVKLVDTLAPENTVPTRRMLMARIDERYEEMKTSLRKAFDEVPYVTVTADCWTSFRRCYLAATVSWLEPASLKRNSAVLICQRMTGSVTHDKIADLLLEVFKEYGLQGKVTKVVTDNGSNFVKAFRVFGEPVQPDDLEPSEQGDEGLEFVEVAPLLENVDQGEARLPPHHRCAAHTLNLVATTDTGAAERHEIFSRPFRSVLRTCRALWNKQGQSAVAAETIRRFCGKALIRPVATRWNSLYDALECVHKLDAEGKDFDGLCRTLQVPPFQRPRDLLFIEEYCKVMKPLACAIDVVQREEHMFMGYLLPTITVLQQRLSHLLQAGLAFSAPLVNALLDGIQNRFGPLINDRELLLAAIALPRFKVGWVLGEAKRQELAQLLTDELNRPCYGGSPTGG
ncbi:uncharacterized protein LOC115316210 [Ixodes scapularis]|uniref:uncharacterized protein LOC115316210 n=1 Tax=Ixodes scapularis TaxID=6945 RepID=UPI001C3850B7|nr:uncharacterized protein LOC115316210 [Ixodes scapularis]